MTLKEVAVGQTVKVAKLNGEGPQAYIRIYYISC